ncbi:hypothetical protein [Streptomyces sp. NBC_00690]|uniref:hypothetical protein n=1 Tax=Streptomyces sp. NBC_00690 TaxID=2975808 RepID=UPI002E2BCF0E|nr:hypothetical protein [Streptomyces sp. NBC_00690]
MRHSRFTGPDKVSRNLKATAVLTVPCVVFLLFLIFVQGIGEAWVGLAIVIGLWGLLYWRFQGVGRRGLPPQR